MIFKDKTQNRIRVKHLPENGYHGYRILGFMVIGGSIVLFVFLFLVFIYQLISNFNNLWNY